MSNNQNLSDRINLIISKLKMNKASFSKLIGIDPPRVSQYTRETSPSKPNTDFFEAIKQKLPQVNLNWLLGDLSEPMMLGEDEGSSTSKFESRTIDILKRQIKSYEELTEAKKDEIEELLRRISALEERVKELEKQSK